MIYVHQLYFLDPEHETVLIHSSEKGLSTFSYARGWVAEDPFPVGVHGWWEINQIIHTYGSITSYTFIYHN